MAELFARDIQDAISVADPEAVLDNLNAHVLKLRKGIHQLSSEAATELLHGIATLQDPLAKVAAWEALEFSPPFPELFVVGLEWLQGKSSDARAQALGTLLSVFPDKRDSLIEKFGNETDQFIRYHIARSLEADHPREAWERLRQLVDQEPNLSMELEELIPDELAAVSSASDLLFIEQKASLDNNTMVWHHTEQILRERLKMFGD